MSRSERINNGKSDPKTKQEKHGKSQDWKPERDPRCYIRKNGVGECPEKTRTKRKWGQPGEGGKN